MVVIKCPECGKVLESDKINLIAHARMHWGVDPRAIGEMRNKDARERYLYLVKADAQAKTDRMKEAIE